MLCFSRLFIRLFSLQQVEKRDQSRHARSKNLQFKRNVMQMVLYNQYKLLGKEENSSEVFYKLTYDWLLQTAVAIYSVFVLSKSQDLVKLHQYPSKGVHHVWTDDDKCQLSILTTFVDIHFLYITCTPWLSGPQLDNYLTLYSLIMFPQQRGTSHVDR